MGKSVVEALCSEELCTGCMACVNICRHGAITIGTDSEGFYRPIAVPENCVDCGLCRNICPQKHPLKTIEYAQKAFRCWHKDKRIRRDSSSGGLFSAIGDKVIENGGIVYGVKLDETLRAILSSSDLDGDTTDNYKGSKYVQARIEKIFTKT